MLYKEWYSTPLLCQCSNITFSFLTSRLHILSASFYRVSTIHVQVNAETSLFFLALIVNTILNVNT